MAYFVFGGISFGLVPSLRNEFLKYPAVYRSQEGIKNTMPFGMAAMFVTIVALAFLYALLNQSRSGVAAGARFGALIGIYSVGSFVVHNYVNLNIGGKLSRGWRGAGPSSTGRRRDTFAAAPEKS